VEGSALRRIEAHFQAGDGARLFRRAWHTEGAQRALVVVHGFAEHSGRYEDLATWFAARGMIVHAYDQRGHGRSQGRRGHVERFDALLDDLAAFLDVVREEDPALPMTVIGHSMGGLVVSNFLVERQPMVSSAVLSGPALALGQGVSRGRLLMARLARRVAPRLSLDGGVDPHGLSRDPDVVRGYLEDPLVFRRLTASMAAEMLGAIAGVRARGKDVAVPLLALHGEEDALCPVDGTRAFFAEVESPGSALRTYPGLRHEIFQEPEREKVYEDILSWLREMET
jgi:alpha-beta hydrolase superfamily lysophospholipase